MRVIQVGMGLIGEYWIKTVLNSEDVEFAALVEVKEDVAADKIKRFDLDPAMVFRSLPDALDATSGVDGVIDVTPPHVHKTIALTAMDAGLPVLSEKPLSDTPAGAAEILEKSNATGVLHMVAQNYRFRQATHTVKTILESDVLGKVAAVTVNFHRGMDLSQQFHKTLPHPLLQDMAIHHFDLMRYFLGANPLTVRGHSYNPPWTMFDHNGAAMALLEFPDDVIVNYHGSWTSRGLATTWNGNWRFDCEKGVLELIDDHVFVQRFSRFELRQAHYEETEELPLLEMARTDQAFLLNNFFETVMKRGTAVTPVQDNIKSINMVYQTMRACDTGEVITFEEHK